MVNENKIEQLLKAFYDGDTTPEEEAILLYFFKNEYLNKKWYSDRDMFSFLYNEEEVPLPEGITERLEIIVDKHISESSLDKNTSFENEVSELTNYKIHTIFAKRRNIFIAISSAAAITLLCIGLFFASEKNIKSQMFADTYTNPEDAALATEQALLFVSNKLNQGLSSLEKVRDGVEKTNKILNETITIEK